MSRPTTATVDEQGYVRVKLPARLRKKMSRGAMFRVQVNGSSVTLTPAPVMSDEEWGRRFDAVTDRLTKWAQKKGVTKSAIRAAVKRVRTEAKGQKNGRVAQSRSR